MSVQHPVGSDGHARPALVADGERVPLLSASECTTPRDISEQASLKSNSSTSVLTSPHPGPGAPSLAQNDHTEANQTLSRTRTWLCIIALGGLILLQATNISMLTTTQSTIADELEVFEQTSWFTSSYLISMSALAPLNGKLSSVFSPRICIFVSSLFLAAGSVATASATGLAGFVTGRAIAGIGASGVFTVSIILVLELTGSKHRGLGIGSLNSGYTLGVAIGATVAGALLGAIGWRALFWGQAPIALVSGLVLLLAIPGDFTASKSKPNESLANEENGIPDGVLRRLAHLDYLGASTLTTAIVLLLYALSSPRKIPMLPIILAAVTLLIFIVNEVYWAADPVIPVTLLRSRGLLLTCLATVGYMMARWSVLFYIPTYAIAVRLWPPAAAGSLIIPTNLGFAVGGLLVGWLHIRRKGSFYLPTLAVYAIFPVTLIMLALLATQTSSIALVVLAVFLCGFMTGAALNYSFAHLLHLIPTETHYVATGLLATFRGFAGSFGSAVGGGLFTRTLSTSLTVDFRQRDMLLGREGLIRRLLGSPQLVGSLDGVEKDVAIRGYEHGLKTLWLAGASLAILMVGVQAGTGWQGHEEKTARKTKRAAVGVVP